MIWKMSWLDRLREFLGLPYSAGELAKRRAYIEAGNGWPPVPKRCPPPPPLSPAQERSRPDWPPVPSPPEPVKGESVAAVCEGCGKRWDAIVTDPKTATGGVLIDVDRCPTCGAGYSKIHVLSKTNENFCCECTPA